MDCDGIDESSSSLTRPSGLRRWPAHRRPRPPTDSPKHWCHHSRCQPGTPTPARQSRLTGIPISVTIRIDVPGEGIGHVILVHDIVAVVVDVDQSPWPLKDIEAASSQSMFRHVPSPSASRHAGVHKHHTVNLGIHRAYHRVVNPITVDVACTRDHPAVSAAGPRVGVRGHDGRSGVYPVADPYSSHAPQNTRPAFILCRVGATMRSSYPSG